MLPYMSRKGGGWGHHIDMCTIRCYLDYEVIRYSFLIVCGTQFS